MRCDLAGAPGTPGEDIPAERYGDAVLRDAPEVLADMVRATWPRASTLTLSHPRE